MAEEVAVFVDFENLRYGLLNNFGQEPDIPALVRKANKYGRPSVMRAYADFAEHPPELCRRLQVAGIEAINVPVKRTISSKGGKSVERVKNAADMVLALDAVTEAFDADARQLSKVFLLVTGDRDYVKLVTLLRNRFGQRVVIAGVPGSTARDLVEAAGEGDPIEAVKVEAADSQTIKSKIVKMVKSGPHPLRYWSLRIIDQWSQEPRREIPGTAMERRDAIGELRKEGVLVANIITDTKTGRQVTETVLDEGKARELKYLD